MMAQKNEIQETARIDALFERISALIEHIQLTPQKLYSV